MRTRLQQLVGIFLFVICTVLSGSALNRPITPNNVDALWNDFQSQRSDTAKIAILKKIASYYINFDNNTSLAENISQISISIALASKDDILLLEAYNNYLEVNDLVEFKEEASRVSFKAKELSDDIGIFSHTWRTYENIAKFYKANYKREEALKYCEYSLDLASNLNNEVFSANSLLTIGKCHEGNNDKVEAFKNYLGALGIAEKLGNKDLLIQCYSSLSKFYNSNQIFEKARLYKQKELDVVLSRSPIDSLSLMYLKYDFQGIAYNSNNNEVDHTSIFELLSFAERSKNQLLKNRVIGLYRAHVIQAGEIDKLDEFYSFFYPKELDLLKISNPQVYSRVKALLFEEAGNLDSAYYYFHQGEKLIQDEPNKVMCASFYKRYGQFLLRQKDLIGAVNKFETSLKFSIEADYIPYAKEVAIQLEELHILLGSYKKAHEYSKLGRELSEDFNSLAKQDKLLRLEIDNEAELKNMDLEKQRLSNLVTLNKQKNLSRLSTVVGIGILLLAISLWSRLKYVRKIRILLETEKSRSDELLLNILPQDVAEELKAKGRSDARHFSGVSVLFTDFANFTGISEKMSAQKLVKEIGECFEYFDEITSKYDLEKIKTIGDAYLAAGGLSNKIGNSAKNTVLASLEMQKFIKARAKEKESNGELSFQMRAGIHTGPLVAGIVGAKKFQYDIWGDTVNTASRMENNCEINKVNISFATYELLRDDEDFVFESRGIVSVKGKGFMDMYYVQLKSDLLPIGASIVQIDRTEPGSKDVKLQSV